MSARLGLISQLPSESQEEQALHLFSEWVSANPRTSDPRTLTQAAETMHGKSIWLQFPLV